VPEKPFQPYRKPFQHALLRESLRTDFFVLDWYISMSSRIPLGEVWMKRVAIYIRVSTSKQDTDNQRRELEAVADRSVVDGR
jgi:hypothetical protein